MATERQTQVSVPFDDSVKLKLRNLAKKRGFTLAGFLRNLAYAELDKEAAELLKVE